MGSINSRDQARDRNLKIMLPPKNHNTELCKKLRMQIKGIRKEKNKRGGGENFVEGKLKLTTHFDI